MDSREGASELLENQQRQEVHEHQDQPPEQNVDEKLRNETFRNETRFAITRVIIHSIWTICYFVVFNHTDSSACTGPLYDFGNLARWCLAGFVIWDFLNLLGIEYLKTDVQRDKVPRSYKIFHGIYFTILIAFWMYSVVALAKRNGCTDQPLTTLLWVWVILYALLPCVFCCCLCCGIAAFFGSVAMEQNPIKA
mgnify:CR=1 FL=1